MRTGIEVTVLAVGWLLGGTVGIGTLLYAVAIGPLAHVFIPLLKVERSPRVVRHGVEVECVEPVVPEAPVRREPVVDVQQGSGA